jgi:16S rRNA (guanine527-N7)-methyltransferase
VDSIGKKIKVATEVSNSIGLKNVKLFHSRGEEIKDKYHFVVTRAVMPLIDLMKTVKKNIGNEQFNLLPNGIIALKGGELNAEMASMKNICTTWDLKDYFNEEFFETKKVVHVTVNNK